MDIIGTVGDDVLIGTSENDYIQGLEGYDELRGEEGRDHLDGGEGDDYLYGGGGGDLLHGGEGYDVLKGGYGADVMRGGSGDDAYFVDDAGDEIYESNLWDWDYVYASVSYVLPENVESLNLTGTDDIDATGNDGYNELRGNDGANHLSGLGGDDYIDGQGGDVVDGGAGNDYLGLYDGASGAISGGDGDDYIWVNNFDDAVVDGGAGNDFFDIYECENVVLRGGAGDDEYYIYDLDTVTIEEFADGGYDKVWVDQSYTMGEHIEAAGAWSWYYAINVEGNALDNNIYIEGELAQAFGGEGNDTIESYAAFANGGAGDDWLTGYAGATLRGGGGNDTLFLQWDSGSASGDSGSDTFVFQQWYSGGESIVEDFNGWQDSIRLEDFAAIGQDGVLGSRYFYSGVGAVAQDASDRIIFDTESGALYYDRDGNGAEEQQQIGIIHIAEGLLNHTDFVVA